MTDADLYMKEQPTQSAVSFARTLDKIDPNYPCLEPYLPEHLGRGHLWPEGGVEFEKT